MNLFATVRDKSKKIVPTLKQEDFRISEDNQEQKIAFFSREVALPITLALLLDTSGSEQDMLAAIQDAGSQFIGRIIRKGDEALVMSFDANVDLLSDFTDERGQLERAIRKSRINIPDQGIHGRKSGSDRIAGKSRARRFIDAIYLACGEKLATEAGRKAIVIVTDAQDEGSKVKLDEAIEAAQRTDTVIHILLVVDPRYGGKTLAWRTNCAEETGGRMISVRSEKETHGGFRRDFPGAPQTICPGVLSGQPGA